MTLFSSFWNHKWALSLASGFLLGISFSPFPFPFSILVFPAFILVFRLASLASSAREMAYISWPGLVLWNLITTYWLMFATVAGGLAAILANSAIMTLPLMFIWHIEKSESPLYITSFLVPAAWLTYEFLHFRWDLSWPWLSLGNSFATAPWLVQYISVTGMLGITFWIVMTSWLFHKNASRKVLILIALIPPAGSLSYYFLHQPESEKQIEVAIMQPNYDSYLPLSGYPDPITPLKELLEISNNVITPETRVIFWPENALEALIIQDHPREADRLIQQYVTSWGIPLITGSAFLRRYEPGTEPPVVRGTYQGKPYNIYNAALGFYQDNSLVFYKKAKLVPLVERIPFVHTLSKLDYFNWLNWNNLAMFGRGTTTDMFKVDDLLVPALICYDSVYPDWVRRFVNQEAAFLVVITNDGWWGNTSGHIQHFEFARLRAVETGRTVLRSANNGLSGVIHANGDVVVKTQYWTRDHFVYPVPVYEHKTFYVRHGDWIGRVCLVLTVFGSILLLFRVNLTRWKA